MECGSVLDAANLQGTVSDNAPTTYVGSACNSSKIQVLLEAGCSVIIRSSGGRANQFDVRSVSASVNRRAYCPSVNPLKPNSSNYYTLPYTPNLYIFNF